MIDERERYERAFRQFQMTEPAWEILVDRRDRKRRNKRIGAGVLAIILALVSFVALTRAFRGTERPANETTPRPPGIFSGVGGWITYGNRDGIWAVDPMRPDDPNSQIQLSTQRGTPLAWSSDGSRLLILRNHKVPHQAFGSNLFVLNADGTETRLTEGDAWFAGGSFSPDGSKVLYGTYGVHTPPGIFVVDAGGGTPPLLLTGGDLLAPTFSPDGSKIAYFAWNGQRYRLRVMNADGTGSRAVSHAVSFEDMGGDPILVWSPDGTRLAIGYGSDIYTVKVRALVAPSGANGSDLTLVVPHGGSPNWSPDGSRIAYEYRGQLEIARADGTHVQTFGYGAAGPWNPLPLSVRSNREPAAPAGGATPLVYALVALGVVGVFVLAWRGRRRTAAR